MRRPPPGGWSADASTSMMMPNLHIDQIIIGIMRKMLVPRIAPVHWGGRIGNGETKLRAFTLVAAPERPRRRGLPYTSFNSSACGLRIALLDPLRALGSTAACWRPPRSGSHRPQNSLPPTSPAEIHASNDTLKDPAEKCRCHGNRSLRGPAEKRRMVRNLGLRCSKAGKNQRYARLTLTSRQSQSLRAQAEGVAED